MMLLASCCYCCCCLMLLLSGSIVRRPIVGHTPNPCVRTPSLLVPSNGRSPRRLFRFFRPDAHQLVLGSDGFSGANIPIAKRFEQRHVCLLAHKRKW
uniref:Putative secreted protein n=1 Tax=Anopheles marajoara TaxID=58244 RepID=A0A2M4C939_9DIPT